MKRRKYLTTISAAASGLVLAGCSSDEGNGDGGDSNGSDEGNGGGSDEDSDEGNGGGSDDEYPNAWYYDDNTGILLEDSPEAEEDSIGSIYIRGNAVNESGNDYDYVQIDFDVLDGSGAKVADALANTSGLNAGQSWRYEALATSAEDGESFELADITAY